MNFGEFKNEVSRFVRTNTNDPDAILLIGDAINIAMYDLAREKMWSDLLKVDVPLTIDELGTPAQAPLDLLQEERFRFVDSTTGRTWKLFNRKGMVPPAPIYGKPRAYETIQDSVTPSRMAVIYEPFLMIIPADVLLLSYYSVPALLVADADVPVTVVWDTEIIKRAEHYILTHLNKLDQAKQIWASKMEQMQQPAPAQ